jgi:transposase
MGAHRTDMHRLQELVRLHRLGRSRRDVARLLGMGRDTIRQYEAALAAAGLLDGPEADLPSLEALGEAVRVHAPPAAPPRQQRSKVELHRDEIERQRLKGAQPKAIHDWLRLTQPDYQGSLAAVKRLVRRLAREAGPRAADVAIRVETAPGEVAQVDFVFAGLRFDGVTRTHRRSWLFVMTLGFSRRAFYDLVFDQKAQTWARLHVRAFEFFGGAPRVLVPDNLKSAVIRAAFGVDSDPELNRTYRELARHYGVQIDPTPPRAPEKKGKVERDAGFVRRSFLLTHDPVEMEQDRRALARWSAEVAAVRTHGTTGRAPIELFEAAERAALLPLPAGRYEVVLWKIARVHRDVHVQAEGGFYSVPWRHTGKDVWVRLCGSQVSIFLDDVLLATHPLQPRGGRSTIDAHLPEHRGDFRHRAREHWTGRAVALGPEVSALVEDVFASDDVLHQLRKVQAIVRLLEEYPRTRAENAARRARRFGCLDYRSLKNILVKGLDLEPLPGQQTEFAWMRGARYARRPAGVCATVKKETTDGAED